MDALQLLSLARDGDRRALARLMRVVEDRLPGWEAMLGEAWTEKRPGHLVGVTGAPGSGKSTLVNGLISAWRAVDRKVAVVAVDPSSPFSGGALLGDRIRMQDHISDPDVFLRSTSNRGRLGGVADATSRMVTVLESVGFDPIVVETVGVGQAEVDVVDHSDTVVVVVTPGWGDSVQTGKAGVLEIGDVFVVNKADRPDVEETRRWLKAMLEMGPPAAWQPPIISTVATEDEGIEELADALDRHRRHLAVTPEGLERRRRRGSAYLEWAVTALLHDRLRRHSHHDLIDEVLAGTVDPWTGARRVTGEDG